MGSPALLAMQLDPVARLMAAAEEDPYLAAQLESEMGAIEAPVLPPPPRREIAPPQQPVGGRLTVPRMIRGAILGATTPNVAEGGAVDVLRAMQAADEGLLQRDILEYNMERQRRADEALEEQRRGMAEYYRGRAQQKPPQRYVVDRRGVFDTQTGQYISRSTEAEVEERFNAAKKRLGLPDAATMKDLPAEVQQWVFEGKYGTAPKPPAEKAPPRPTVVKPGDVVLGADNKPVYTAPFKPERPGEDRGATPAQYRSVESEKGRALRDAERQARARIRAIDVAKAKGEAPAETPEQVWQDLEDEKQRIQDSYEAQIEALGGSTKHVEYGSGAHPAQRRAASAAAQQPAPQQTQPAAQPAGKPRVFPRGRLKAFAAANRMTEQQAEAALKARNWMVQ